jgi:hypothetical protein
MEPRSFRLAQDIVALHDKMAHDVALPRPCICDALRAQACLCTQNHTRSKTLCILNHFGSMNETYRPGALVTIATITLMFNNANEKDTSSTLCSLFN